jgi:lipopolysaccharide transport protein LptA
MSLRPKVAQVWMVALAIVCLWWHLATAATGPADQAAQDEPVQVTADRMVSETRTDQVVFSGNVEVHRGDLYIKADRLEVRQDRQSRKVSHMVAIGNVFIRKGEQAATAARATFFENEQKAVLTGNPHAWEGTTQIWGEEMVFLLAEGSMIVTSGSQRVRMQMLPENGGTSVPQAKTKARGG